VSSFPNAYKQRILTFLDVLARDPIPYETYDIKKLKGFENVYRVRFGSYRLIYAINEKEGTIKILKVAPRECLQVKIFTSKKFLLIIICAKEYKMILSIFDSYVFIHAPFLQYS